MDCTTSQSTERGRPFDGTHEAEQALTQLKQALTEAPLLSYPLSGSQYMLDTDASDSTIGVVLSQLQDGEEQVLAYYNQALS